jgi:hypothetical protein
MRGIIGAIVVCFMFVAAIQLVSAVPAASCSDTDGGKDIWTAGTATDNKGSSVDDCDGASENLKEQYCDGTQAKFDNIKCSDYNAICVSDGDKTVPDYCACDKGYVFDADAKECTPDNDVPEFGLMAGSIALIGVIAGAFFLRKK